MYIFLQTLCDRLTFRAVPFLIIPSRHLSFLSVFSPFLFPAPLFFLSSSSHSLSLQFRLFPLLSFLLFYFIVLCLVFFLFLAFLISSLFSFLPVLVSFLFLTFLLFRIPALPLSFSSSSICFLLAFLSPPFLTSLSLNSLFLFYLLSFVRVLVFLSHLLSLPSLFFLSHQFVSAASPLPSQPARHDTHQITSFSLAR